LIALHAVMNVAVVESIYINGLQLGCKVDPSVGVEKA
jgi:hypothetical protein